MSERAPPIFCFLRLRQRDNPRTTNISPTPTPTPTPTPIPVLLLLLVGRREVLLDGAGFGFAVVELLPDPWTAVGFDVVNKCVSVAATSTVSGTAQAVIGPETTVVSKLSSFPRLSTVVVEPSAKLLKQPANITVSGPPPVVSVVENVWPLSQLVADPLHGLS